MKYIDYYPPVLSEIYEIKVLGNVMDELLRVEEGDLERLKNELYIATATEIGLSIWEKALEIEVVNTDIEARRFEIRSRLFGKKMSLRDRLNVLLGEEGYSMSVDYMEYFVLFYFLFEYKEQEKAITEMLERLLPLNLNYDIKYNGTFEFSDREDEYNEKKSFADPNGSIGGYLGLDY